MPALPRAGIHATPSRIHLLSPRLCGANDALRRLSPTLPKRQPLDILDINPGNCIWSTKVHDFLKPKRHVLIEPEKERYSSFLQPLLSSAASAYRYASSLEQALAPEKKLLSTAQLQNNAISSQTQHFDGWQLNSSILVIANLTSKVQHREFFEGPLSKYIIYLYLLDMLNRTDSVHKYGLVRMIAWLPDEEKSSILPRSVAVRGKQAVMLESGTTISEIAGGNMHQQVTLQEQRNFDIQLESHQLVAYKMASTGITQPDSRRCPAPVPPLPSYSTDAAGLSALIASPQKAPWMDELYDLENRYAKHEFGKYRDTENQTSDKEPTLAVTQEFERLLVLRKIRKAFNTTYVKCLDLARRQRVLDAEERLLLSVEEETNSLVKQKQTLEKAMADLEREITQEHRRSMIFIRKCIDDYRAFDQKPPVLAWDRRSAEPLLVKKEEFSPQKELALLDFQPKVELLSRLDTPDKRSCFSEILSICFEKPSRSLREILKNLVPGDLDSFLQKVPSLQDPAQGGKPNLDGLTVRSMPVELFVDLALAWESWAFRIKNPGWRRRNNSMFDKTDEIWRD